MPTRYRPRPSMNVYGGTVVFARPPPPLGEKVLKAGTYVTATAMRRAYTGINAKPPLPLIARQTRRTGTEARRQSLVPLAPHPLPAETLHDAHARALSNVAPPPRPHPHEDEADTPRVRESAPP
ncbi:hypothetical protein B0H19DRAFT_1085178 [Mycena capillaripes]|nr:hypothetical protein B0H19DRAFT_1085178 [Mycena capillaripes]